jgi:predicted nucleotidyltransferase
MWQRLSCAKGKIFWRTFPVIDLTAKQVEIIRRVMGLYFGDGGARVYLYGSRAKGTSWKYSDVDLAIDAPQPLDILLVDRIKSTLSIAGIPYRIDISDLNGDLSPIFRENIDRCKKLLFDGRHILVRLPSDVESAIVANARMAGMPIHAFLEQLIAVHYTPKEISLQEKIALYEKAYALRRTSPEESEAEIDRLDKLFTK